MSERFAKQVQELANILRDAALEEAAQVIDNGQETHSISLDGDKHYLTPRRKHNTAGLVYADAIRALKSTGA